MRGLLKTFLLGALMTAAGATSVMARGERSEDQIPARELPKDQSEHATVDRIAPEFDEFYDAMKEIKSRYEERDRQKDEAERRERDRRRGPPPAGAPAGPDYGTGFAGLPLQEKLAIMQESFRKEWAQKELDHKKWMDDYAKELDRKSDRLDNAIASVPGALVKAGEPPALVERFRKEWLRPDAFYHRELLGTYFASKLGENEALYFLKDVVFPEFKKKRVAEDALKSALKSKYKETR